jgi:DNA-binding transcriptional regulator GbsR (MarR family)
MKDWQTEYINKLASTPVMADLPPTTVRVLAWLIVAETPEKTSEDIQTELNMSSGSVSMALNTLHYFHLVERIPTKGSRKLYYRAVEDMTAHLVDRHLASVKQLDALAEQALKYNPQNTRLKASQVSSRRLLRLFRRFQDKEDV